MKQSPPDAAVPAEGSAQLRDRLLSATRMVAATLMLGVDNASFRNALRVLGEATDVSRVHVCEVHPDGQGRTMCVQRHEWCAEGVVAKMEPATPRALPMEVTGFGRWLRVLEADEPVYGPVADLPIEEQPILLAQSVVSIVVLPMQVDGVLWGFIGFDDATPRRWWTPEVIDCLRVTARVVAGAIDRRNYRRRNDEVLADYEQLIDSLDDVVFRFDAAGRWTFLSPAWSKRLGWTTVECLGRPAVKSLHRADRALALRNWTQVVAGRQQSFRGELRFQQIGGGYRWMLVAARSQRDTAGAISGVTGTLTDITAAKMSEAELIAARTAAESANKSKSEFLSTMSHELRTPLNAVIGLSESLLETHESLEPARTRRYLEIIHSSGRQLLAQINAVLDLARIEAGRVTLAPTRFDLGVLAASVVEGLQCEWQAKSLQVTARPPGADVWIEADERLLRQALHNLVANAVKFTPAGGDIAVTVEARPESGVSIEVKDTGIGIPVEQQDRLFKPFSQVDASLSRHYGGTGLGLSLVERIVRLHGGRVSVVSAPGAGSTFCIALPPAVLAPAVGATPAVVRRDRPRRVMIVDDDSHQHTLVGDYLRRRDFEVVHCDRAEAALQAVAAQELALAVVDLSLPGMSGLD